MKHGNTLSEKFISAGQRPFINVQYKPSHSEGCNEYKNYYIFTCTCSVVLTFESVDEILWTGVTIQMKPLRQ